MEQFDVLDCAGRRTGARISRDDAHADGVWHGAFHCLMIYRRDGRACVLFQKRSGVKKIAPGKFDVSVGGHYSAGEDAAVAGPREIREELGLVVPFSSLLSVGRRVFVYCFTPGVVEYEFQDVFLLPLKSPPKNLTLQQSEVDAVLEMEVEKGIELFDGRAPAVSGLVIRTGRPDEPASVAAADFVPSIEPYYLKLLLLARRYFQGERDALVI